MKNRLWVFLTFMVVFAMMLVACGGGDATEEVTEPTYKAVVIMPNPLGDRSFIDSSARGIEQANNELDVKAPKRVRYRAGFGNGCTTDDRPC
jgi:basic membrane protein A